MNISLKIYFYVTERLHFNWGIFRLQGYEICISLLFFSLNNLHTTRQSQRQSTRFVQEFFEDKCVVTLEIIGSDIKCQEVFMRKWARGALWNQWLWTKHQAVWNISSIDDINWMTLLFLFLKNTGKIFWTKPWTSVHACLYHPYFY